MARKIFFDLDGTLYDLYGQENWLPRLLSEDTTIFTEGDMLVNLTELVKIMLVLKGLGYSFGVVTWTPKEVSKNYCRRVRYAKEKWLRENFGDIFDEIHVLSYGNNKNRYAKDGSILFDDEKKNRQDWSSKDGFAFGVNDILGILHAISTGAVEFCG